MPIRALTVKERILLHLFEHASSAEAYEVPADITQAGIARATGIRVHHVPQYVRPLMAEGLVEERTAHVRRGARRRKAYSLAPKGRSRAAALRTALLREPVPFRSRSGEIREVPLLQVHQEERRGASLLDLLGELAALGTIAEGAPAAGPSADFTQEAPSVPRFYGRREEIERILRALEGRPVVVATGMAGIGKSTLGAKICEGLRGRRPLFWRTVRPWDTPRSIALRLAVFLRALGRTDLHGRLLAADAGDLGRIEEGLLADLAGSGALLVFDDIHEASRESGDFFAALLRVLQHLTNVGALLLSRTVPDFYSRREVDLDHSVEEITLGGLDPASSVALLADAGLSDSVAATVAVACGGVPLFLRLLAGTRSGEAPADRWKTVEAYIGEQIEPSLDASERACLEVASFYHLPIPAEGLLLEADVRRGILLRLERKALLAPAGSDRYAAHDVIRGYFRDGLSRTRRRELGDRVVAWLEAAASSARAEGQAPEAAAYLGNAAAIEEEPHARTRILRGLGDVRRHLGDYPGALDAYRDALRGASEGSVRSRLHREAALCLETIGRLADADAEITTGLGCLPPGPSLDAAWLHYQRASIAYERQDYEGAFRDVERLAGWMRGLPEDRELWGWLANLRGLIHLYDAKRRDANVARADFEEAVASLRAAGQARGLCMAYNNLALAALESRRPEEAVVHLDASADLAARIGDLPAREIALFTKAWYLTEHRADYSAAEALYHETYRLAKETNQRIKTIWHYYHFANLYRRQGRAEEAREALEHFLAVSGPILNAENRIEAVCLMARLCLACEDGDAATACLSEAESLLAAEASVRARAHVEWARARASVHRGDIRGAEEAYERAAEGPVPDKGEILLDYGRLLVDNRETARARDVLSRARVELAESAPGLVPLAEKALRSLG